MEEKFMKNDNSSRVNGQTIQGVETFKKRVVVERECI